MSFLRELLLTPRSQLLRDATRARKWLETVIIEVYYILGQNDIWTCRRNIVIDIDRHDREIPPAVVQELKLFPQTNIITEDSDSLVSAMTCTCTA